MVRYASRGTETDAQAWQPVLDQLSRMLGGLFSASAVSIALLDSTTGDLITRASEGFPSGAERPVRIPLGASVEGWVAAHLEPVFTSDAARDGRFELGPLRSVMCAPLVEGGQLLGTVLVGTTRPRAYESAQQRHFLLLASVLAFAVSGLARVEVSQTRARELSALLELARALAGSLDAAHIHAAVLASIRRIAACDDALLYTYDDGARVLRASTGRGERFTPLLEALIPIGDQRSLAAWVARNRRGRLITADEDEDEPVSEAQVVGERMALLCVPLICRDRLGGVMLLARAHPFHLTELTTMANLSGLAAAALDNVARYQRAQLEREQLAAIFGSASDGMAVVDSALTILDANSAFGQLVGQPHERIIGQPCCDVLQRHSVGTCSLCDEECLLE
nr:GAF domain-containing protein [Ktedonobacterales bacterium]